MSKAWLMVPLGEVLTQYQEYIESPELRIYPKLSVKLYGKGVSLDAPADGTTLKMKRHQIAKAGQVILSEIWGKKGAIGFVPIDGDGALCTSHFFLFDVRCDKIDPKWLQAIFSANYLQGQLDAEAKGTTGYAAVRPKHLLAAKIPLPPLSEQKRIVARLEELAAKIEEARGLRLQSVAEAEALLLSSGDAAFKLSKGWVEACVGDFCEQPQYGYTASAKAEPVGPKMLRITDIQDGKVDWDSVPFCDCHKPEQYLLQNDDIVFARTGATTGKSFLIRECPEAVFASYLIRLRVQKLVTVDYLYQYFQTPSYWAQITDTKKGTGQPNVNGKKLANILVPIAPFEEQRLIVAHLDGLQAKVDALKRLQAETSAELNAMLPSVLDRALKGELV